MSSGSLFCRRGEAYIRKAMNVWKWILVLVGSKPFASAIALTIRPMERTSSRSSERRELTLNTRALVSMCILASSAAGMLHPRISRSHDADLPLSPSAREGRQQSRRKGVPQCLKPRRNSNWL